MLRFLLALFFACAVEGLSAVEAEEADVLEGLQDIAPKQIEKQTNDAHPDTQAISVPDEEKIISEIIGKVTAPDKWQDEEDEESSPDDAETDEDSQNLQTNLPTRDTQSTQDLTTQSLVEEPDQDLVSNYDPDFWEIEPPQVPLQPFYKFQQLSPILSHKTYSAENSHISPAFYPDDYKKLVFYAILHNNIAVLDSLLDMLDIDELITAEGGNMLIFAVKHGKIDVVRSLVARGFDVRQTNSAGVSAFDLAEKTGRIDILNILNEAIGYYYNSR
ncbi:hypothetical protein RLOatenuis_2540 [Rickettsiales bacterium]|nr:hypothetical protein RLOatenuis_2540 [Rickettsiales bacterium]